MTAFLLVFILISSLLVGCTRLGSPENIGSGTSEQSKATSSATDATDNPSDSDNGSDSDSKSTVPTASQTASTEDFSKETEDNNEENQYDLSLLDNSGKPIYRLVRGSSASEITVQASSLLNNKLKEISSFLFITDTLGANENEESVKGSYEILVGDTSRQESIAAKKELKSDEYIISITDCKIVIAGGSDMATYKATEKFISMLNNGNGMITKKNGNFLFEAGTKQKETAKSLGYLVGVANQRNAKVEVYDFSYKSFDDPSALVWSYTPTYFAAGLKLRNHKTHGNVALIAMGTHHACMVSYPSGQLLWETDQTAYNPHSIELMPNGVIAVAASNGNTISFFIPKDSFSEAADATVTLTDAHGVLWDDENQVLWAVGRTVLTAYKVTLNANNTVTVTEDTSRKATIPSDHAHDLSPVYSNKNELWITTASHVYRFNKTTKEFSADYDGNGDLDRASVKGVGNFKDGSLIYIYPDKLWTEKPWNSKSVYLVRNLNGEMVQSTLTSSTGDFYKVRVWSADYQ